MTQRMSRRMFIRLTGASAAAGVLLAACSSPPAAPAQESGGDGSPSTAPIELVFSSYTWSGYEAAMQTLLDEFMVENPDIKVEGQFVPDDYWTKLQTQVAGGTPPDVGIGDYGRLVQYAKSGVLLPISDMLELTDFPLDKMFADAVGQYRWAEGDFDSGSESGELYGLPSDGQGQLFAYNKNMFDEAGVAYPTDEWTWDDLVAAGKAITNADENKWGFLIPGWGMWVRGWFAFQADGSFATPDFKTATFDSPGAMESIQWLWDLAYTHKIAPPPGLQAATNPFMSGQVAMTIDGIWWVSDFATITDFEWDMAMLPKNPQTGKYTTTLESDGWWIYSGTQDPDASFRLLTYFSDEAGQKKFGDLDYVVPSCFPEVGADWYGRTPPENRGKALDNLVGDSAKAFITFFEVWTILGNCMPPIEAAFADGTDINAAIMETNEIMQEELDKAWELFSQA